MRFMNGPCTALVAALILGGASGGTAAETPYPTVDFQGDWVLEGGTRPTTRAQIHYSADMKKMRLDLDRQGVAMSSVRDMESGETIIWTDRMPGLGMKMTVTDETYSGERTDETKTVGDETCTIWIIRAGRACLSEDNIPLETTGEEFRATLENLDRSSQDASLFAVPEGLQIMDMPTAPDGGPAGGPGGQNPGQGLPF